MRVASLDQARAAQACGAVGVLVDSSANLDAEDYSRLLDGLSIHVMCDLEHREALLDAYAMQSDASRPGHFIVTKAWRGTNLKRRPILPIAPSAEDCREAVARGAALVILDLPDQLDAASGLREVEGDESPTLFAQVDDLNQAVAALESGMDGLLLNFLPDQSQLPRLKEAMTSAACYQPMDAHPFLIGVIALQGDYRLQKQALETMLHDTYGERMDGFQVALIRSREALSSCDALLLPGGWSNLQSALLDYTGLATDILEHNRMGKPILALCAGMVLAGSRPGRDCEDRRLLGLIDVRIENNMLHGEKRVTLAGGDTFEAVFSNGPVATELGSGVEIIARLEDGGVVAARQDDVFISAYHKGPGAHDRFLERCVHAGKL